MNIKVEVKKLPESYKHPHGYETRNKWGLYVGGSITPDLMGPYSEMMEYLEIIKKGPLRP